MIYRIFASLLFLCKMRVFHTDEIGSEHQPGVLEMLDELKREKAGMEF